MKFARDLIVSFAFGLALVIASVAHADPIYKCGNGSDGIVYTDTPCKGGDRLEINAGVADPAALDRLKETRDALDRSADRRVAAQQLVVPADATGWLPPYSPQYLTEPPAARDDYPYADYAYAPGWYVPAMRPKPRRPRSPTVTVPRFAPPPPYVVPRP